jgi:hypothetical protein
VAVQEYKKGHDLLAVALRFWALGAIIFQKGTYPDLILLVFKYTLEKCKKNRL